VGEVVWAEGKEGRVWHSLEIPFRCSVVGIAGTPESPSLAVHWPLAIPRRGFLGSQKAPAVIF
jgi:hypothetical protein